MYPLILHWWNKFSILFRTLLSNTYLWVPEGSFIDLFRWRAPWPWLCGSDCAWVKSGKNCYRWWRTGKTASIFRQRGLKAARWIWWLSVEFMTRFPAIRIPLCMSRRLAQTLFCAKVAINTELQRFWMSDSDFLWSNKWLRIIMETERWKCWIVKDGNARSVYSYVEPLSFLK